MPVVPVDENSVKIAMVESMFIFSIRYKINFKILGNYYRSEFDCDYPNRLNGIIRRDEFEKSIANINKIITSTHRIIWGFIILRFSIGGFIMFVVGTTQISNSKIQKFALLGVGISVFFLGILSTIFGCCIAELTWARRVRPAIDNESKQYSTRSPAIPCV